MSPAAEAESQDAPETVVGRAPMDDGAWCQLGDAYRQAGQHELAAAAFRQAARLQPHSAYPWWGLCLALDRQGRKADALDAARRAAVLAPADAVVQTTLGRVLLDSGRPGEAVAALQEAVRLRPAEAWPRGLLGVALCRTGRHGEAAESLEVSLRIEPDQPIWATLGFCLQETGRWEPAAHALQTATFADPENGWAWGLLGRGWWRLDRPDEALRAFERAVAHGFSPTGLWEDFAAAAAKVRDLARLERACRELDALDPNLAQPLWKRLRELRPPCESVAQPVKPPCRIRRLAERLRRLVGRCLGPTT